MQLSDFVVTRTSPIHPVNGLLLVCLGGVWGTRWWRHEEGVSWKEYGPEICVGKRTQNCGKDNKRYYHD